MPYGMDKSYIDTINPSGVFRNWIWSSKDHNGGRTGVVHLMTLMMTMKNTQSASSQDIGMRNIAIREGEGSITENNIKSYGKEVSFAFSKAMNSEWKLMQGSDEIR